MVERLGQKVMVLRSQSSSLRVQAHNETSAEGESKKKQQQKIMMLLSSSQQQQQDVQTGFTEKHEAKEEKNRMKIVKKN